MLFVLNLESLHLAWSRKKYFSYLYLEGLRRSTIFFMGPQTGFPNGIGGSKFFSKTGLKNGILAREARRDFLKTDLKNEIFLAREAQKIDFYKRKSLRNEILSEPRSLKNGLKKRAFGSCCEKKTGLKNGLFAMFLDVF